MRADRHLIVVAPHPDDETLALGGTIYDHLRAGGSCEIVAVTDGEGADDRAGREARAVLALRRDQERRNALALLGADRVTVKRLRLPDRDVSAHEPLLVDELQRIFVGARRSFPACVVALPWRDDPHADHRATSRAGLAAAVRAGLGCVETPIWAWYDLQWRRRLPPAGLRRVAISPAGAVAKQAALRCFTSQLELLPGGRGPVLPHDFIERFAGGHEVIVTSA
jgi:LmbE family N-acetylglucosaminyl deacetylase